MINHEFYIRRCFQLAELGKGLVAPNPMVGAVLVHNGRIIGQGWHRHYGANHAEVDCLNAVAPANKHLIPQSTMYVNLEPCAHHGKTPPCANRLVKEGIKNVVIANTDPFPQVSGKGISILQNAGIKVTVGILEHEGLWLNRRFFCLQSKGRPYIILKWAQTADAFIAHDNRSRVQISNPYTQQLLHKWRTEEAAILVGTHTVLIDNPQLTARLWKGHSPLRVIVDKNLSVPNNYKVFDNVAPTWIINQYKNEKLGNITFIKNDFTNRLPQDILQLLKLANINSLIIEGGATLLSSFINAGLWDEARIFTASNTFTKGLPAPTLTHAQEVFQEPISNNVLTVFTNQHTAFPYRQGMQL